MPKPSSPASHSSDIRPIDPADRARVFTVHLRDGATPSVRGRLTHVGSGVTAHFDSGDELVTLLVRLGFPPG